MKWWFLLHRRVAKAPTSMRVRMTSPGLSLLAVAKYASWRRLRTTFRHLVALDTPEWAIIRGDKTKSHVCLPFSHDPDTFKTLVSLNSNWWFIIIVSGLKIKPVFAIQTEFEKKCKPTLPRNFYNISIPENERACPQQHIKDTRLSGMLTYKVGHPCRLRFS